MSLRRNRLTAPLEPRESFLQLTNQSLCLVAGRGRGVGPLGQRIDELQDGVVEDALVGGKGLDVPAHELAEEALDGSLGAPAGWALRRDRPESLRKRPGRLEFGASRVLVDGTTSKLLTESVEQGGDVDLLRRGNTCRRRVFRLRPGHSTDCTGWACQ